MSAVRTFNSLMSLPASSSQHDFPFDLSKCEESLAESSKLPTSVISLNNDFVFEDSDNETLDKETTKQVAAHESGDDSDAAAVDAEEDFASSLLASSSPPKADESLILSTRQKLARFRNSRAKRYAKRRRKSESGDTYFVECDSWWQFINANRRQALGVLVGTELDDDSKKSADEKQSEKQKIDKINATEMEETKETSDYMADGKDFMSLPITRPILKAIRDLGWQNSTPIQSAAIEHVLRGSDLLLNAVTGSGKTAAFMIPILERLALTKRTTSGANSGTRVVVVTPTRELAAQCRRMTLDLAKYLRPRIDVSLVVGGLPLEAQESALRRQPDVVVCTPGRMIDLLRNSRGVSLDETEILVLDEADRLLDMGFKDELDELLRHLPPSRTLTKRGRLSEEGRQTLLLSATLTSDVLSLAQLSLTKPLKVSVDSEMCLAPGLTQEFVRVKLGSERLRRAMILALCLKSFTSKTIVFCRTKKECHNLALYFGMFGLNACELHGNMSQTERLASLQAFSKNEADYLLCTDVAARGIDIAHVATVVNVEFPTNIKTYIHRVGRTARAGHCGTSVTLVGESRRRLLKKLVSNSAAHTKNMKSRSIHEDFAAWIREEMADMRNELKQMERLEENERQLRLCERQLKQSRNLLQHSDEIAKRPPKTWFVNRREKRAIKEASHLSDLGTGYAQQLRERLRKKIEASVPKKQSGAKKQSTRKLLPREQRHKDAKEERQKEKASRAKQLEFAKKVAAESMAAKRLKVKAERKENRTRTGMELVPEIESGGSKVRRKRYFSDAASSDRLSALSRRELGTIMTDSRKRQKRVASRITSSRKRKTRHAKRRA